ncbi:hypothetical protein QYM36_008710 [Artemia franciscana]|uniref:Uncharacterized protein n=1 Tax=Artemia franciscana TaxID=6661 RepID=A0AA88HRC1_ARTSF|nr:hypothetical protein QYM36_008710 [Artemia franciscana]
MNCRFTKKRKKKLASEFAQANQEKSLKLWDHNEAAGQVSYKRFMKRDTRISLRRPESRSLHCNLDFSQDAVAAFYVKLDKLYSKHHFPADHVYNMDETGLLNVQQKCLKVLSPNGAQQLGAST